MWLHDISDFSQKSIIHQSINVTAAQRRVASPIEENHDKDYFQRQANGHQLEHQSHAHAEDTQQTVLAFQLHALVRK